MKKVILFIAANIGKIDSLHDKVTAAFNLWNTIYAAIKPLLPAQAPVAAPAPVTAADEVPLTPAEEAALAGV